MNPKEFFRRWKDGLKNLSAERQLKAHINGAIGNIIGFTGGIITMSVLVFYTKQYHWWWTVFILVIALFTTVIDLIGKKQQLRKMTELRDQLSALEKASVPHDMNETGDE